jgi:hypothetical protein
LRSMETDLGGCVWLPPPFTDSAMLNKFRFR